MKLKYEQQLASAKVILEDLEIKLNEISLYLIENPLNMDKHREFNALNLDKTITLNEIEFIEDYIKRF